LHEALCTAPALHQTPSLASESCSIGAVKLLQMGDKGIEGVSSHKAGVAQAHGNFLLAICMKEVLESKAAHAVVEDWYDFSHLLAALIPCTHKNSLI
jgi:hypothetical protein